ncbi:protoporphyrinogen oxidase [Streptomyces chumphonensis]|uniref:Coproporphyrinogen III oxidase n=1 Tax=Streptomyces chumphonensis TaxID=1214925 RepID=A0A927EXD7_9ACTN|nr:protoporphyrinogen oxidase [Streptomyces chumphonensis]MBD3931413.1 protoporphyrinogen oxidase [Streptomyces chumphonensis]
MRILVIGGGISGLVAAHRLLEVGGGTEVTVLEASARLGGKLRGGEIAGVAVDLGAESMLARRPEAVELARAVGLGPRLEPPAVAGGAIWTRGAVRPMPGGHLMGVPGDPAVLGDVLSPDGLARVAEDADLPRTPLGEDVTVGGYVAERLGREVVDRLVEPLLGGVYAGDAYRISLRAALPQLFEAARRERSLLAAVRSVQARAAAPAPGPVFMGVSGGVGRLPGAVADAVRAAGGRISTGVTARDLRRTPDGWAVATDAGVHHADAVVLALPGPAAARLLRHEAPDAADALAGVGYASMALCTLAFRRADLGSALPGGSGFLVPPVDGRTIKASTFSANKWGWVAAQDPELFVLRTSVGRFGEEAVLERDDDALVAASLADLRDAVGLTAAPVASRVTRWPAGLPQYALGHRGLVARVRAAVARMPGLEVCGALYDGVGIPACVASASAAAEATLAWAAAARGRE